MLAKVTTCAVVGLEGAIVEVEVDISPGLPSFTIPVSTDERFSGL
jgi:magnesium chelatase family protein